jgi:hypothetical protein
MPPEATPLPEKRSSTDELLLQVLSILAAMSETLDTIITSLGGDE